MEISSPKQRQDALEEGFPCKHSIDFLEALTEYQKSAQRSEHVAAFVHSTHECLKQACNMPCLQMMDHFHQLTSNVVPFKQKPQEAA